MACGLIWWAGKSLKAGNERTASSKFVRQNVPTCLRNSEEIPVPAAMPVRRREANNLSEVTEPAAVRPFSFLPWPRPFSPVTTLLCSLHTNSSILLAPRSPQGFGDHSPGNPLGPSVLCLLLAAAWCLHWGMRRLRMPHSGERVSQQGGQRGREELRKVARDPNHPSVADTVEDAVGLQL